MKWLQTIIYEQPFNENMRFCLRLEHLFSQVKQFFHGESSWHSRATLDAILEISAMLERPDLKSMFVKEMSRYHTTLNRLLDTPHVDQVKLRQILDELENMQELLYSVNPKIVQHLRENDLLSTIRSHRSNPGGVCQFEVPSFQFWLNQPYKTRIKQLSDWLQHLEIIDEAASLMLRLVRESSINEFKTAQAGAYQQTLDPKSPWQLARIIMPAESHVYPEISVGRHRLAVRFLTYHLSGKPQLYKEDVIFKLSCCVI